MLASLLCAVTWLSGSALAQTDDKGMKAIPVRVQRTRNSVTLNP